MFNLKKITAAFSGPASAETIQRELLDSTDAIIAEARAIVEKGLPELSDKARKLVSKSKGVLSGVSHRVVAGSADNGTIYRLQAVAPDAAAANALCSKLKGAGLSCMVK